MKLLGVDLETGGSFDGDTITDNFITEVGVVLWDTEIQQPVKIVNEIVNMNLPVSSEASIYNGITSDTVMKYGITLEEVYCRIELLLNECDYFVAQNGLAFDKPILDNELGKIGLSLPDKTWIDLKYDCIFPQNCMSRSLTYLAGFHGFCNPFPHRAVTDVLSMFKIMKNYDIDKIVENAKSPLVEVVWKSEYPQSYKYKSKLDYVRDLKKFNETKDKARKLGFRWVPEEKEWVYITRECLIPNMDFTCIKRSAA